MSHGLLFGERKWSACVGIQRFVGVLRQESNRPVSWGGLRLGEVFHVADALVVHVFGRVQWLFWTVPRVLAEQGERRGKEEHTAGSQVFPSSQQSGPKPKWKVVVSEHNSARRSSVSETPPPESNYASGLLNSEKINTIYSNVTLQLCFLADTQDEKSASTILL